MDGQSNFFNFKINFLIKKLINGYSPKEENQITPSSSTANESVSSSNTTNKKQLLNEVNLDLSEYFKNNKLLISNDFSTSVV